MAAEARVISLIVEAGFRKARKSESSLQKKHKSPASDPSSLTIAAIKSRAASRTLTLVFAFNTTSAK